MNPEVLVLSYAGCSTCKKALAFLTARGTPFTVRPIVDAPPTARELAAWIPASALPVRKWLNTSGLSYRALGKDLIDASTDADLIARLTKDGKLVKRPVLIVGPRVAVGFTPDTWNDLLA